GIAAVTPFPESVAQDDFPLAPGLVLPGLKSAAALRRNAQYIEKVGGHQGLLHPLGLSPWPGDVGQPAVPGSESRKRGAFALDVGSIRRRGVGPVPGIIGNAS